jgi:hypothetical protein
MSNADRVIPLCFELEGNVRQPLLDCRGGGFAAIETAIEKRDGRHP